jgi:uncharacterized OB-fold protein
MNVVHVKHRLEIETFLYVNAEEFTDIEVEEDSKPITSAVIKLEPAVSCVSGIMQSGQISRVACHTVCLLSIHRIICTLVNIV